MDRHVRPKVVDEQLAPHCPPMGTLDERRSDHVAGTTTSPTSSPIYRHLLSGAPDTYRLPLRSLLLLAAAGTVLLALSLAWGRPLEKAEAAVGRSAERMLAGGNLLTSGSTLVPVVDVAPVDSWSVAMAMAVFGQADWVVRLPSAVATLATALLVALLATRWFGRRIGLLSGLIYLTTAGVLVSCGASGTDAWLTLCVTVAFGAFGISIAVGRKPQRRERWIGYVYFAASGISFLLAGPAGPLFILAGSVLYLYFGEDPQSMRFYANPVGVALFFVFAAAWPVTIWLVRPAGFEGHFYGWFAGAGASPWRLVGDLTLASLPWTPLAVLALVVAIWRGNSYAPSWRLFASWLFGPLMLMAIGLFRQQPHIGLVLPPLAVMAAVAVVGLLQWAGRSPRVRTAWIAVAWLGCCAAAVVALRHWRPDDPWLATLPVAVAAAGLLPALVHRVLGNRRPAASTCRAT